MKVQSNKLGFATAATACVMYATCMCLMSFFNSDQIILVFNALLHGFDVRSVMLSEATTLSTMFGFFLTACIGWFIGWFTAVVYNNYIVIK